MSDSTFTSGAEKAASADLKRQRSHVDVLGEFLTWVLGQVWGGLTMELDGADVQDKLLELGLIRHVPYDPTIHGTFGQDEYDMKPGDEFLERVPAIQVGTTAKTNLADEAQQKECP
jgi:hypothetical protein